MIGCLAFDGCLGCVCVFVCVGSICWIPIRMWSQFLREHQSFWFCPIVIVAVNPVYVSQSVWTIPNEWGHSRSQDPQRGWDVQNGESIQRFCHLRCSLRVKAWLLIFVTSVTVVSWKPHRKGMLGPNSDRGTSVFIACSYIVQQWGNSSTSRLCLSVWSCLEVRGLLALFNICWLVLSQYYFFFCLMFFFFSSFFK